MDNSYKTLIIDDEAPAREGLQDMLKEFPETFKLVGTAENATEAEQKIQALEPDIIFLDIEMPGCTGFELLARLKTIPIVVFCTAYDQYSLEAFETNSIDYLVKPVKLDRIEKTVQKLKTFHKNNSSEQILKVLKEITDKQEVKKMTSITIKKNDKLIFLKLEEIAFFESDSNYVNIHSETGVFLSTESIGSLEDKLPNNFIRIHRGIIINKDYVKEVQRYFNSRYIITLEDKQLSVVTSGRSYSGSLKSWLGL